MNHSSPSDYLDAVMEAGFLPVESDELPNDLAWLAKSSAEAYREEPETVTIVYEDDTVVEVRATPPDRPHPDRGPLRPNRTWAPMARGRAGGAIMIAAPGYPDVQTRLTGKNGNPFLILGTVQKALREAGVPEEEVSPFTAETTSGDMSLVSTASVSKSQVSTPTASVG
jgi:hypothetical protein